jgi:integrase
MDDLAPLADPFGRLDGPSPRLEPPQRVVAPAATHQPASEEHAAPEPPAPLPPAGMFPALSANIPRASHALDSPPRSGSAAEAPVVADALARLAARAAGYAAQSSGAGTQRAYASAWRGYAAWCAEIGRPPLSGDPGLVALYLTKRAEENLAVSSLKVARAAIIATHRLAEISLDAADRRLSLVMEGIVRDKAGQGTRQAAPAVPDVLRRLLGALPAPNTPQAAAPALAARHRAMLLIGFGAALRRSEIVALTIGDVVVETRGLTVLVRRSKTDQQGKGKRIAIWANHRDPAFCAVAAFEAWMGFRRNGTDVFPGKAPSPAAGQSFTGFAGGNWRPPAGSRPLFCGVTLGGRIAGAPMSDKVVARLIKQACRHAGLDPARFSGHSLRRGLLTNAGDLQLPLVDVMRQSRHKSVDTAMGYIEDGDAWRNNITEPVFR